MQHKNTQHFHSNTPAQQSSHQPTYQVDPWHLRLPTTEHYQWFKNLVDLHEMTAAWIKEAHADRPSYGLTRGLSKEVSDNLWMLDSLSQRSLEDFLDDTRTEDLLGRLEHTVWAVQSWTISSIYNRTTTSSRDSMDGALEQICWKLGKANVENRWSALIKKGLLPLRDIILALNDSPLSGYPNGAGFLIKRAIQKEIQIELRSCPHQSHYAETKAVADRLCRLHNHWIRGFAYGLNPHVSIESVIQPPRCAQRWFIA